MTNRTTIVLRTTGRILPVMVVALVGLGATACGSSTTGAGGGPANANTPTANQPSNSTTTVKPSGSYGY
ncbi:MAG TPA: hypothetical protein VNC61_14420 [Acidimicrobiales bacterium]|nr:hypothetical protein [Acidimicrobiales bacterium]